MSSPATLPPAPRKYDAGTRKVVLDFINAGVSKRQIARELGIPESSVRHIFKTTVDTPIKPEPPIRPEVVFHDKKIGGFNWRESIALIQKYQELRSNASWSQHYATIEVGDGSRPIAILFLSDMHIGSIGADHGLFLELTDLILHTPNLYVAILGDVVEMAIKLRSVAEVCAQILEPELQSQFMEQWIEEIEHKVIFCTWGNHESDRNEQLAGCSPIKNILAKRAPYFNGIGHADIIVGTETYKFAASHKFAGVTKLDCTAGCKKYLREEYPDGEIAVQGDSHRSGITIYNSGGKRKYAISSGTLQTKSGYSQRYFSLLTSTAFPVVVLRHDKHMITPYFTIAEYFNSIGIDHPPHKGI